MAVNASKSPPGLSAFLHRRDGIDSEQALSRAELHLTAMRDKVHLALEESVNAIGAHIAQSGDDMPQPMRREMYQLSDGILSVAAMYDKAALGQVAYSLCDLITVFNTHDLWDSAAVRLHHDAMRLLQTTPNLPEATREELLSGLRRIVQSFNAHAPHTATA